MCVLKDKNGKFCVEVVKKIFIPVERGKDEGAAMESADEEGEDTELLFKDGKAEMKYFVHCHLRYVCVCRERVMSATELGA